NLVTRFNVRAQRGFKCIYIYHGCSNRHCWLNRFWCRRLDRSSNIRWTLCLSIVGRTTYLYKNTQVLATVLALYKFADSGIELVLNPVLNESVWSKQGQSVSGHFRM